MLLKLFVMLVSANHIFGYRGPTFRSSIMEGNKPILRMSPENSAEQIENSSEQTLDKEPLWMEELRSNIQHLIQKLGHKKAKPHIEKLVEETEDNNNVLLHVEVSRDGISDIQYKYQMRASFYEPDPFLLTTMKHQIMTPEPDPQWLADLKVFIKELIGRYGKRRLDEFVTPIIKAIQKQHNVLIKDIDVDHYGEVYITYIKRSPFNSPWTKKRSKKLRKKSKKGHKKEKQGSSDESPRQEEDFRRVTEMPTMED